MGAANSSRSPGHLFITVVIENQFTTMESTEGPGHTQSQRELGYQRSKLLVSEASGGLLRTLYAHDSHGARTHMHACVREGGGGKEGITAMLH